MTRRLAPALSAALLALTGLACSGGNTVESPAPSAQTAPSPTAPAIPASNRMVLQCEAGDIEITLDPAAAPKTVAQIKRLAASGFYSGVTFHRVLAGDIIQGGDPLSRDVDPYNDGTGEADALLPLEKNRLSMTAGAVAMARDPRNPDSASCQFFICLKDHPDWKGHYTIFGRVTGGMDTARKISRASVGTGQLSEHPLFKQTIRKVEFR